MVVCVEFGCNIIDKLVNILVLIIFIIEVVEMKVEIFFNCINCKRSKGLYFYFKNNFKLVLCKFC